VTIGTAWPFRGGGKRRFDFHRSLGRLILNQSTVGMTNRMAGIFTATSAHGKRPDPPLDRSAIRALVGGIAGTHQARFRFTARRTEAATAPTTIGGDQSSRPVVVNISTPNPTAFLSVSRMAMRRQVNAMVPG